MYMNQVFSQCIRTEDMFFKHGRGSSDRSGKEFHIDHEIIYFLDGDAEFVSEGLRMRLKPKTLILIPKETFHQMVVHGDQEAYYRCFIHFPDLAEFSASASKHLARIKAVKADDEIEYLFQKLIDAYELSQEDASAVLKAVLVLLVNCLGSKTEATAKEDRQSEIIRSVTQYINNNMEKRFLVSDAAAASNVSESTLSHIFKKEMNISLHQFVLRKRLMAAYHKIASGQPATEAAMECGFHDYSGFYKQYKKMFGFSPSQKVRQSTTNNKTTDL